MDGNVPAVEHSDCNILKESRYGWLAYEACKSWTHHYRNICIKISPNFSLAHKNYSYIYESEPIFQTTEILNLFIVPETVKIIILQNLEINQKNKFVFLNWFGQHQL